MDALKRFSSNKLPKDWQSAIPTGTPTLEQVREAVKGRSQADVAASARRALEGIDQQKLTDFGKMMQETLAKRGIRPPAGVTQGNANDIAEMMAAMLKSKSGVRTLLTEPAVQDSAKGVMLARLMTSKVGLFAMLLRDPRGMAIISPVLKSLIRMK